MTHTLKEKEQAMNGSSEHVDTLDHLPVEAAAPPDTTPPPPGAGQSGGARARTRPAGGTPSPPRKSPLLAGVLSLLPGVGQVYVGYYMLGFIHNIVFAGTIVLLASYATNAVIPLLSIFLAFFFIYNVVDAARRAMFYNLALDGGDGLELPHETSLTLPTFGGSIGGGVAIMVTGFILLLNTRFGVSLAWVEDWWPLAPMILGAYLVGKALRERTERPADHPTP